MNKRVVKLLRQHQEAVFPHVHGVQKESMLKNSKRKWNSLSQLKQERIKTLMLADIQQHGKDKTSEFAAAVPIHIP